MTEGEKVTVDASRQKRFGVDFFLGTNKERRVVK
jgi:hypothetical protein